MKFKGILLDIDNTLYNYDKTHNVAKNILFEKISEYFKLDYNDVEFFYKKAREEIHTELHGFASSHNRLLYVQRLLELASFNSLEKSLELYNIYWDVFIENIELYDYVYEFLNSLKNHKVCLLTDLTADIQFKKVVKLKLDKYADFIVTSEEAGVEKPDPKMFELALKKIDLKNNDVCMIGDNFYKDILGAYNMGIQSFWINEKSKSVSYDNTMIKEFDDFKQLTRYIHE